MQAMRQIVHALRDDLRAVQRLGRERLHLSIDFLTEQLEIDLEQRHLLTNGVVQLARDVRALGLLRVEEPGAEIPNALVGRAQLILALEHTLFGLTTPCALKEQPRDERRLRDEEDHGADDVDPVAIPERLLPIEDA